jgi:hypothetical protein
MASTTFTTPEQELERLAPSIAEAKRMLEDGKTLEEIWCELRGGGLDMIDSATVTVQVSDFSRLEARRALYESDAWADMRPVIDQLEDDIIEAALSMGAEVRIDGERIYEVPKR